MANYIFGYLSGIFILLSFAPYLAGIFLKRTRPERMSWFIWALLGAIAFYTQLAKGASNSLWLPGVQALGDLLIFLLAIKYGMGGLLKRDLIALCAVVLSLFAWYFTKEPTVALFLIILIDGTGAVLTVIKSYEHPATEPVVSWVLTALAGASATLAVGGWNWILLTFPIYTFLANFAIVLSILLGRISRGSRPT